MPPSPGRGRGSKADYAKSEKDESEEIKCGDNPGLWNPVQSSPRLPLQRLAARAREVYRVLTINIYERNYSGARPSRASSGNL